MMLARNQERRWASEDIRTALRNDISTEEIANLLGRSVGAVRLIRSTYKRDSGLQARALEGAPEDWQAFK